MSLAIYRWEWAKFPWAWAVKVRPEFRVMLTQELAEHFCEFRPVVRLSTRNHGLAFGGMEVALPQAKYTCKLGLIMHEVAHLLAHAKGSKGHDAAFKAALIRVHVEARVMKLLPAIFERIRATIKAQRRGYDRAVLRESARAFKRAKLAEHRRSRGYKMDLLRARIKRLESKKKRLETGLKSAKRSLAAYERFATRPTAAEESIKTGGN